MELRQIAQDEAKKISEELKGTEKTNPKKKEARTGPYTPTQMIICGSPHRFYARICY